MNSILVLKNKAINATGVTDLNTFDKLEQGALAIVLDGKQLYDPTADPTDFANVERVQFVAGVAKGANNLGETINTLSSVPIPRRQVIAVNIEYYKAPQVQIVQFGPFNWEEEGDIGIQLNNNSYVGTIKTAQVRASVYKLPSMTEVSVIDKIVSIINTASSVGNHQLALNTFCKAEKVGSTPADLKIKITMLSEDVNFSYSLQGMMSFSPVQVLQKAVISLGKGEDVVRTEEEYSGNLGNGGYWGYNEGYFNKPLEANASETYNIVNITWMGEHDDPQNRHRVARNHLMLPIPSSATTLTANIVAALTKLFGNAFDKEQGSIVPSSEDTDETAPE